MNRMRRLCLLFIVFLTFYFSACGDLKKGDSGFQWDPALLKSLNQALTPISGSNSSLPDGELGPLADLEKARIVGLGEATHGTHEFFEMKHRLFRYLVEHFQFKVFAFECDFAESVYFDRYINGEEGDIDFLMKNRMHFWTCRNASGAVRSEFID